MAAITLVGTAIMAVILLVVVLALARGIDWRSNEIFAAQDSDSILSALAGHPVVWGLAFVAISLGTTLVAILAVGGFGISVPGGGMVALAPFALLLFAFLIAGTYSSVRDRNVSPAGATLATALVLGSLLLVAITVHIMLAP